MSTVELAYIQVDYNTKLPINETAYCLWLGCQRLDIETQFFSFFSDIRDNLKPETLVHGYISHVKSAIKCLGKQIPELPEVPPQIEPLFGRKTWTTTLGEIRKTSGPVFIKPLKTQKAFTGFVFNGTIPDLVALADHPDDMEVVASDPVSFVSEYRYFVHNQLMIGCRHYAGDFEIFPERRIAHEAIASFKNAPCGYSLDVGVTGGDGRTLIVEVNDAWALGSYGMDPVLYTQMIVDRWVEMMHFIQ
jgi:hypothetical protein